MFNQGSEKALLTFQDVVACFSQVERELLHKWQKDLYTNVMKEIHQIFLLLGPVIANSVFSLRAVENEGLCPLVDEDPDRSNDSLSQSATISELDVCTVSREVVPRQKDPRKTDRMESPKLCCTERWGNPDLPSKDRIESTDHLDADRRKSHDPLGTDRKESPYPLETDRRKSHNMLSTSQMNWCKEQELTIVMISDSIKEEEKPFPMAGLNPGDVKNFPGTAGPVIANAVLRSKEKEGLCLLDDEDSDRRHNDSLSQKQELTIVMTSDSIKEEKEVFPMAELDRGDVKNSCSPAVEQSKEDCTSEKEPHASADYKKVLPLKSTNELYQTIQTDKNLFTCTVCEHSFAEKESLQVHMGIHRGIKLFPCNKCEKSFTQKANLQRHMRIHMGVKPFPCTECEKSFRQYCDMQRHMRIHTGVKPFHCTECGKRFTQKAHLQGHLRIHTVVKPFPCPECEKSFTPHCDHQCHRRIQAGGKPFHCTVCGRSFSLKTTLQCHMKTHTRAKPFS